MNAAGPIDIDNISNFNPTINVTVTHNGSMSDKDAKKYGEEIADKAIAKMNEAFRKRGITNISPSILKP